LPSIIPSYAYTLFASIVVGALLILAFNASTISIRNEAERQQLRNLAQYFATKSCELVSATMVSNLTTNLMLNVPAFVGNQRYWIQLRNDSSAVWVESGLGTYPTYTEQRAFIPEQVSASGVYLAGSGAAVLECYSSSSAVYLQLSGGN
jgi:hypothetical protein